MLHDHETKGNKEKEIEELRKRAKERYLEEHPELVGLDEDELAGAIIELTNRQEEGRKTRLREHLEFFSDAIIAIIITIMVLEIPLPMKEEGSTYAEFVQAIGMFLVSFFLVASFWLDHHRSFDEVEHISNKILIADFIFLAALSVLPILTKWIMLETDSFAVINFGVVYLVVNLLQGVLLWLIAEEKYAENTKLLASHRRQIFLRKLVSIIPNLALIGLAFFQPLIAMIWFLAIPILSFIMSGRDERRRMAKNQVRVDLRDRK